jgi:hypothetical protein
VIQPADVRARAQQRIGLVPDRGGGDIAVQSVQGAIEGLLDDHVLLARLQPIDGHRGEGQQGAAAQDDDRHDDRPQGQQAAHRAASRWHAVQDLSPPGHGARLHARVFKR